MDADKYFTDRYNQNLEDDVRCAVYGRGLEHVNKWSLLMACSEDPYNLVVTEKHIEAALMFVRYQIKTVLEANDSYVYKNEDEKNTKRVRQVLRDNGGQCSRRDLMRKTRFSKKRMNDVLSTMEDSGDIELEVVPTAGRPSTIIRIAV
jgi:hypothetical protein